MLKNFGKNNNEEILDFSKRTFSIIYKEPYQAEDGQKMKVKYLEKRIKDLESKDKVIDAESIIESAKELKEFFPEETVLKRVVEFFSKLLSK